MAKQKPLNILMLCKSLPWQFKGGIQTHTWELARALRDRGNNVAILNAGSYRKGVFSYTKEEIEIIQIPYLPGRHFKPLAVLLEEFAFNRSAKNWVKNNHQNFDIIHAQGRSGYLLYSLKALRNKLITTVHGLIEIESSQRKWYDIDKWLHKLMAARFEQKQLNASKQLIAVSKDLKTHLNKKNTSAVEVISNGVNFTKMGSVLPSSKDHTRFLFIGRLHPIKNILPLVKAMSKSAPFLKLDIVGNGELREQIKSEITKNGLENRVRLIGELTSNQINKIIPKYQALVLPSHYETQGIVLMEANAQAIPVIASDIPAIRETVEHNYNGLLCNPNDLDSFVAAMAYLSNDSQAAQHMGLKGQVKILANYQWPTIADKTEAIYRKMTTV